jgi:hypothetical protein
LVKRKRQLNSEGHAAITRIHQAGMRQVAS